MLVLLTLPRDVRRNEWRCNYKRAYMMIFWVLTPMRLRSASGFTRIKCSIPEQGCSKLLSELPEQAYPMQHKNPQAHHLGNTCHENLTTYISLLVNTTLGRTTVVVGGVATQEHFSVPHSLETLA
jgi:hypothetical protein